jgi:hypothetical protein
VPISKSSEMMNNSLEDQSRKQAITILGGVILQETKGKIYAEDYNGNKFEVTK